MPQQINLHNPVLLAPRKHFTPVAMLQALALWCLGLAALSGWTLWRTTALQSETAAAARQQGAERQQLDAMLAARESPGDPAALQQQLAELTSRLAARRQLLDSLGPVADGASPTTLLQSFSRTVPAPVWLTEIRWTPGQLVLAGQTLQPDALQGWLASLGSATGLQVTRLDGEPGRWAFRFTRGTSGAER